VWCKLGDLCDYGTCDNVASFEIPNSAWVLDLEDIEKGTAKLLQRMRKNDRNTTSIRHPFSKGNVLYSKLRTYLNKVLIADTDGFCTTEILPLDFKGFVVPEYARHALMSKMFLDYTAQCGYGVKMPRLGTTDGEKALFPLPPLTEQHRIVSVIESAFAQIDEIETNKISLEQFIKQAKAKTLDLAIRGKLIPQDPNDESASVLLEKIRNEQKTKKATSDISHYPFDVPNEWAWCNIKTVSSVIQYGINESAKVMGNYKFLRITDIQEHIVNWSTVPFINIDNNMAQNHILKDNDILFARTGATVGKSYLISDIKENAVFASYLIRVKPCKDINARFLKFFFETNFYWTQITNKSVGTGQANVNGTALGELILPLPPLPEQKRIVSKIEYIFAQLNEIEKAIKA
jgi:type I restriction enzyme S subunit